MTEDEAGVRDLLIEIRTRLDIGLQHLADHETRLRALERTKWVSMGAAATSGGLLGAVAGRLSGIA